MNWMLDLFWIILIIVVLGGLAHILGEAIPRTKISTDRGIFQTFACENNGEIYTKLGVHAWKRKIPDKSQFLKSMTKKSFDQKINLESAQRLIQETCVAEAVHAALFFCAPLIYWAVPNPFGMTVAILYALSQIPYILIQRYNRPRMRLILKKLQKMP